MSNELDLVFDRQPTECPAVVKERLLRSLEAINNRVK